MLYIKTDAQRNPGGHSSFRSSTETPILQAPRAERADASTPSVQTLLTPLDSKLLSFQVVHPSFALSIYIVLVILTEMTPSVHSTSFRVGGLSRSKPAKARSACNRCHSHKLRCRVPPDQTSCERCLKLQVSCRFDARASRASIAPDEYLTASAAAILPVSLPTDSNSIERRCLSIREAGYAEDQGRSYFLPI